jgi:TetR/AcrR family transcriptional repressor of bet genes
MAPIRRKQLVEAAIAAIHEDGLAHATVARIARRAGVSSGIVHHYFASKDDLLFETMRSLLADLRRDAVQRLAQARGDRDRLDAVIAASFGEGQFGESVFSAWLALYGSARQSPRLRQILSLYHRRLRANLMHDLRKLTSRAAAIRISEAVGAMIDGLWLRYALMGRPESHEIPRLLTRDCLDGLLAREKSAISKSRQGAAHETGEVGHSFYGQYRGGQGHPRHAEKQRD